MTTVAPAQPEDLPAILELLDRNQLPPDGLADHLDMALVARQGGSIVGSVAIEQYGETGLLRSVAVDAACRGHGLGAQLVGNALDLARRQGMRDVYLLTTTASEYFPRFGFRPVSRDDVAHAVRQSVEFAGACPASALAMRAELG